MFSLMHGYENGKHEGYGNERKFFVVCFLLLRRMFSFLLFLWGIDKEKRRQVWMEVETCGESRKVVKSVLIFIYTPLISLSLVSKFSKPDTQRIELPYSLSLSPLPLLPFGAVFDLYFVHPLPSPTRLCLRSWGLSSFLMPAVLEIEGRGRKAFCRPVSSRGLGSPPAGPYGGPGRLRTLIRPVRSLRTPAVTEHYLQDQDQGQHKVTGKSFSQMEVRVNRDYGGLMNGITGILPRWREAAVWQGERVISSHSGFRRVVV